MVGNARANSEIALIPNWTAVVFAAGCLCAIAGLLWAIWDGAAGSAMLATAGFGLAYIALRHTERLLSRQKTTWHPLV